MLPQGWSHWQAFILAGVLLSGVAIGLSIGLANGESGNFSLPAVDSDINISVPQVLSDEPPDGEDSDDAEPQPGVSPLPVVPDDDDRTQTPDSPLPLQPAQGA